MADGKPIYIDWIDKVKVLQKAAIKNKDGRILALRRTNDPKRPRPGCWDLVGGRVEPGDIERWKTGSGRGDDNDVLINSLRREIKEETGLEVAGIRAIHSASGFSEQKGAFIVAIGYVCETMNEDEFELSDEHCEARWVEPAEFMQLEIGDDGGLLKSIIDKIE